MATLTIEETERRREKQAAYNEEHGIEPKSILKDIHNPLVRMSELDYYPVPQARISEIAEGDDVPLRERIARLEKEMKKAAKDLEFEEAAILRDRIKELKELEIYAA